MLEAFAKSAGAQIWIQHAGVLRLMNDAVREHRIWGHALVAAVAMVAVPTLIVSITYQLGIDRPADVPHVFDLIPLLVMVGTLPALALSFGVLAPGAVALDRIAAGRTSRLMNTLLGVFLGVVALLAFLVGGALLKRPPGEPMWALLLRPLSIAAQHPERFVFLSLFFCTAGVIVALGMRHRARSRS